MNIFSLDNPLFFIFDSITALFNLLLDPRYSFMGLPLLVWSLSFLAFSMIISALWKGARG